jgi:hypothetical protein
MNIFHFDGTMLVSSRRFEDKESGEVLNTIAFEQTLKKREIGKQYDEMKQPDLYFVFHSRESIDSVIRVLQHLKDKFLEGKMMIFGKST